MKRRTAALAIACFLTSVRAVPTAISWRQLQPGVEFASSPLYIVRIDPAVARLTVALASETHNAPQKAADWCRTAHLAVAINAGMFKDDHKSNVGYLRHGKHLNNP